MPIVVIEPPPQYQFMPAEMQVILANPAQLKALCDPLNRLPLRSIGCQIASALPRCVVVLLDDLPPDIMSKAMTHEVAHCNGWPASHPRR